ncbi:MAG: carbon-nitrogen hydrolase family protein [Gammaproteobacteria bacterium]|jgi:nitrilase
MSIRVAVIQMTSGQDRTANLAAAGELLAAAAQQDARLAVLPENFAFLGRSETERVTVAEQPGDGPAQAFLAQQAHELGLWIVGGTLPLQEPGEPRPRAACLLYDQQGMLAARYDKIHLFDVGVPDSDETYRESAGTMPGMGAVVAESPLGRLGLAVCYDVRFPELFRSMSEAGLAAVALPSAFTAPTGRAHWELLVRSRAVDNLACVLAAAQWGEHPGGRRTWGDSMIVNHWGEVLARRREGVGVVVADLDLEAQREARRRFPVLNHRRPVEDLRVRTEKDA